MKLACIDTFSGIGGISLALKDFTETVLYCEWNPYCQQVITERMDEGLLDKAPIHADIQTLHVSPRCQPDIVVGGFPCQDISTMGNRQGISDGKRSSMFFHIIRIVDECPSIHTVFLENVGNILKCGMKEVVDELQQRGFNMQWTTKSAGSMGAPHLRNRWFCLACKPDTDLSALAIPTQETTRVIWDAEPVYRAIPKTQQHPNWIQRCQALGNSVVPCVVREAFVELVKLHNASETLTQCLQPFKCNASELGYPYPETGMIYCQDFYSLPKRPLSSLPKHPVEIKIQRGGNETIFENLPTPRRGISHASSLTDRSLHDLPTVLVYSSKDQLQEQGVDVTEEKLHTVATANVNYIEWMMGYPIDWTRVTVTTPATPTSTPTTLSDDDDNSVTQQQVTVVKPKCRLNGMHILMRDNPGKDIPTVAALWRELSKEEKEQYTVRARAAS